MKNDKMITIQPDWDKFGDQFKDDVRKITDDHLTVALKQDLNMFKTALWGCWLMQAYDRVDGPSEQDLGDLVNHWFDLLEKIEKTMEFADLAHYATGFEIPERKYFRHINIENLGEVTQ